MKRHVCAASLTALLAVSHPNPGASRVPMSGIPWDFVDPLLWDSAVVYGRVIRMWEPFWECDTSADRSRWEFAELEVYEVLRGTGIGDRFTVAHEHLNLLAVDEEVVVCADYFQNFRGGGYIIDPGDVLVRRGDTWIVAGGSLVDPYDRADHWAPSVRPPYRSLDQIRDRVNLWSFERVAQEAEVIVEGVVTRVETAYTLEEETGRQRPYLVDHLAVSRVYRGPAKMDSIDVANLSGGTYSPPWRTLAWGVRTGQTWLMFLKRCEVGYYPFAGFHGAFLVRGDTLIFANRSPFKYDKKELERELSRIDGEE